jgi:two-component system, cell cycle sensor histidine kinase and response regulator CckA
MGEKVGPSLPEAELARAKLLRAALLRGSASGTVTAEDLERKPPRSERSADWATLNTDLKKAYLEQLVESAPEAICILNAPYRIMRINQEFTRMFGFTAEETLGQRVDTLIVPPDRYAETQWIGETLSRGEKISLETKRRRKDGTLVDVALSAAPVVVNGIQLATYSVYRNVTEHKRAEALSSALYRIAERATAANDLQQFYAGVHNILGELMYARNLYIALYDPATALLSFPYFVDEEDPAPTPRRLGRGLTEYVLRKAESTLVTPQVFDELVRAGEVDLLGAPSLDWLGVPLKVGNQCFGVLAVQSYTDNVRFGDRDKEVLTFVSQQLASAIVHKRSEEALRRSEARYRSLVESAAYGIYRSNMEGKFLDVNPALVSMLGYGSAEEVLALNPRREVFLSAEDHSKLMLEFRRRGRLDGVELKWKRKDGNVIAVRVSGRVVGPEGGPEEALEIIAEDITERRALEDQFRQAQKMEAVGRLAGGVAHDFNNLLLVISGYAEVMLEQLERESPLHQKAVAIQQSADRATTLTRQLLAFSRKQLLELKVVDVNAIVSDMERLLGPLIGENIELLPKLGNELGRTRADSGQLEQVLMNLVVNSKDAMPEGGRITITTENVTLDDSYRREHTFIKPGPYVMLSVSDTGVGMSKETQAQIFEPFFTTKEKGKGTGLGLSTVYGIVKQSGGYVFVQSELDRGSTFRIYLPRVDDPAETQGPTKTAQEATNGSETVLLVEDEESVRQLVKETLEAKGYCVMEAENGKAGLEVAQAYDGTIDMVITDVVMPGMSGRELAKKLVATRPNARVLYLSGYTEDSVVQQDVLGSGTSFLQKPFTLQTLAKKVREILREK